MPNRLAAAASPYLRQHADNPVDWFPWGEEAFAAARAADRPILLSVGYAACHWCHVMAHESFADPSLAAVMNENFISIKVDREEHPDVDCLYQAACQAATGQGGWPLTVFLTPDLQPFYVGTYFPPRARYGRPGFREVLGGLAQAWRSDRARVRAVAGEWAETLRGAFTPQPAPSSDPTPPEAVLADAAAALLAEVDPLHGGFGGAPKFPNAPALELLLRQGGRGADRALFSLRAMAGGGIHDHLGGGFHRYSVDAGWRVPHFEKMLYDSAVLAPLYLSAFQRSGEPEFAAVARGTLDYLLRELRDPGGGFHSSEDADSPDPSGRPREGAFYTWTPGEIREALGDAGQAELVCRHFGVTPEGNFEDGRSVLHLQALSLEGEQAAALPPLVAALRRARGRRPRPGRDDKILAGWNGLALSALARGGRILGDLGYTAAAVEAARFVLGTLRREDGGLWRRGAGRGSGIPGTLEDYAHLALGLIDLYEATLDPVWLGDALGLARQAVRRFWDAAGAAFYLTEDGRADLLVRPRDDGDSGTPSAQSACVLALLRLHPYTDDAACTEIPEAVFARTAPLLRAHPRGCASLLCALSLAAQGAQEVVVAAAPGDSLAEEWLVRLRERYLPELALSRFAAEGIPGEADLPPVWRGRQPRDGQATLWVCRGAVCLPPTHRWGDVAEALAPPG